jgi:hypothetical protein
MFHLFDKVYLEFDTNISAEINRIIISDRYAAPLEMAPSGTYLNQFYYAKTVSALIGTDKPFTTDLDFLKELKALGDVNSGPLVVYCDRPAFMHLFISWNKSILENVSAADLWKIFRFSIEKETYLSNFNDAPGYLTFTEYSMANWSKADFDTKFDELVVNKDRQWNAAMIPSLGIELLLASYLLAPSSIVKSALKSKILLLETRSILTELYEAKYDLIVNYQNKTLHNILSVSNIETLDELFSHPRTSIFVEEGLWIEESVLYPTNSGSALNLSAINDTNILRVIDGFKLSRLELSGLRPETSQSDMINRLPWIVRGSLTDQELTTLLANEAFTGSSVAEGVDRSKVNVLFVDWILKLHRTANISAISGIEVAV